MNRGVRKQSIQLYLSLVYRVWRQVVGLDLTPAETKPAKLLAAVAGRLQRGAPSPAGGA